MFHGFQSPARIRVPASRTTATPRAAATDPCRLAAFLVALSLALFAGCSKESPAPETSRDDEFQRLSVQGRGFFESGEAERAVEAFRQAAALQPTHPDALQNLANALLRANDPAGAVTQATELIRLNQNLAAAHFLSGAALLRQGNAESAVAQLQISKDIDRTVNATSYLLGRAHQEMGHLEEAVALFDEVTQFDTNHPSAFYNLSQVLTRLGRTDEAARALDNHRAILAQRGGATVDQATIESCIHTEIRVPFRLEQPSPNGVPVSFADATQEILGDLATRCAGPLAVIDINHNGTNDLFVRDGENQFRLLLNSGGRFQPAASAVTVTSGVPYHRVLVGDLNKDRYEDIIVLGEHGLHAFRLATNGVMTDSTAFSNLRHQPSVDGLLADLDFTGNLDLVLLTPAQRSVQVLRNLGNMYFTNGTVAAGFTADLNGLSALLTDDWNGDELNDFFLLKSGEPPRLLTHQRGGPLTNAPTTQPWPAATALEVADFNNDLRPDLALAEPTQLSLFLNGFSEPVRIPVAATTIRSLTSLDYDNDGWVDLLAITDSGLRAWRNVGHFAFTESTGALGLDQSAQASIASLAKADLDNDCDTDLILALEGGGLRVLRNNGGNANRQVQLRLLGTRSNPSGLGLRIELTAGNWRTLHTVRQLPVEIGVGQRDKIDTLNVRWFDTMSTDVDTPVQCGQPVALIELIRPTGSCPYLYRWDGEQFTFVTDLLGGSPVGLPVAENRYIEADPDELVWIGDAQSFQPRNGHFVLQVTEELREVLYLDHAALLAVDHPANTEIHPTDKLVPGRPFPPSELLLLHRRTPLRHAEDLAGTDVTRRLQAEDRDMVSPLNLRAPQLRGHAEPHGVLLDFGPLDPSRPLVLALTGWLRFGGGMANIAASRDPEIPFPFPKLEFETPTGWTEAAVQVGAPCGKTKTILVDLTGHIPPGAHRLRLTTSFEIHWDRIALWERIESGSDPKFVTTRLLPEKTDLHWRGYSEFLDLPWTQPLTPDYSRTRSWPDWRITPTGWCTRYGPVTELLTHRDGGLAILNGGDELTLEFPAASLPPRPPGTQRSFFLFTVGWDKDADFHVRHGDRVDPLPWEGMDDQLYGQQDRPAHPGDSLNARFNTRWVGPMARIRR